jgi:aminoglycoside 2'-N-acetyltransferase I
MASPLDRGVPTVRRLMTAQAGTDVLQGIHRLMLDAFPAGEFSDEDWQHTCGGSHVIVTELGSVVAHAAVVERVLEVADRPFRTGYVEGVATTPARQREGLGSMVMREVANLVRTAYDMGALATARHEFYERLGWERWKGPTLVRSEADPIRTPDDDDGVMVLRFGPSSDIDLTASISCDARAGDVW